MKLNHRLAVVLVLALVGAALAYMLLLQHHGEEAGTAAVAQICGAGEDSGCDAVNRSSYSSVAGIPWAGLGLVFYLSMASLLVLALLGPEDAGPSVGGAVFAAFALGLAVDLILLGIQAFAIHAYCKVCLATYLVNAVSAALLFPYARQAASALALVARVETRVVVLGWALATVGFVLGVAGQEHALTEREALRQATLLGAPVRTAAPPPEAPAQADTPAPASATTTAAATTSKTPEPAPAAASTTTAASTGKTPEELKAAQEEIKRLQDIMADPQKYDRYLAEKNLKEWAEAKPQNLDVSDTPNLGPREAPIKVVEYADYLCPFCRNLAGAFHNYLPTSQGRVVIYFKAFPLDICNPLTKRAVHAGSCSLALGGICAMRQNKFGPYYNKVFATELKDPTRDDVMKLARELGLDEKPFGECLDSPKTMERLLVDMNEGIKAGVTGTPALFINGRRLQRPNEFLEAVDRESQKLGLGPMPQGDPGHGEPGHPAH